MFVKIIRTVVNIISVLLIVLALFVLLSVITTKPGQAPNVLGYSSFRVLSGSMEPTIPTDAMILVKRTAPSQIREGDVISFYSSDPALHGAVNTHRVVSIETVNGVYVFYTKGDANLVPDEYPAAGVDVIGVVVFSSLFLGKLVRLLSNPLVFIPVILVPLVLVLLLNMIRTIQLAKIAAKEEEEAQMKAVQEALERRKQRAAAEQNTPLPEADASDFSEKDGDNEA